MFWKKKAKKHYTAHINDHNFQELVANSELPVLVDFWSGGCGPCKVIGPIIDELAEEFEGRAIVAKVNAAENPNLSSYFKVRSVPTLMFINDWADHFTRPTASRPKIYQHWQLTLSHELLKIMIVNMSGIMLLCFLLPKHGRDL